MGIQQLLQMIKEETVGNRVIKKIVVEKTSKTIDQLLDTTRHLSTNVALCF